MGTPDRVIDLETERKLAEFVADFCRVIYPINPLQLTAIIIAVQEGKIKGGIR